MIRWATADDLESVIAFIRELATYEREADAVTLDPDVLREHLFGDRPMAEVLIAEDAGEAVGFALFFHNFSTWTGKPGLYLEDLFIRPTHRGKGLGRATLRRLAELAVERGCGRVEWAVLDWNTPSIDFYKALGARPMNDWTTFRLAGDALADLARQ